MSQLPALQIVLPLLAAPTSLILRNPRLVWIFTLITCGLTFAISILLMQQVYTEGTLVYEMGGWQAPIGIEYRIDALNAFLLVLVSGIGFVTLLGAHASIEKELSPEKHTYFYIAFLLCLAGLLGILATGDAFNVFVFLEVSALSSYTLIALGNDRRALWASYQYLIMGTIGATFILIGIGLMYMMTGTLNMADMAERLPAVSDTKTIFTAFCFFMVGACLKLAMFPLHLWLPNAYTYAPSIVSVFLAATATKVAVYIMIRFVFTIFGVKFAFEHMPLQEIMLTLGMLGVFLASITAIYQTNVKRLFAYSSVAQIGYIIIGFSLGTAAGLQAGLLHLFNHAMMKGALFMALACMMYRMGSTSLHRFHGLGHQMPFTMAAIIVGGLSLTGAPLTVGFISKWYLVEAVIEQDLWLVAAGILIGSLLAVIYLWRIVEVAYFKPVGENPVVNPAPLSLLIPTWILVIANVYFGIDTRFTAGVTEMAAQALFGVSP